MKQLNKQQMRTQETYSKLLEAAERVFVRDGYEGAQLDEIALAAGRSKGAVYTHFKSKEDLFLVLVEQRTALYLERLNASLKRCNNRRQSMAALRKFYIGAFSEDAWSILTLEFKLFVLRRPQLKEHYLKTTAEATIDPGGTMFLQLFGHLPDEDPKDNRAATLALGPIFHALVLESNFEHEIFSKKRTSRLLGRIFDSLFGE